MRKRFKPQSSGRGVRVPVMFDDTKGIDIPVRYPKNNYTKNDFQSNIGQWITFRTSQGEYRGIVERVRDDAVLVKMPRESRKAALVDYVHVQSENHDIELAGGYLPYPKPFPWCWFWFPFVIIIVFFPWFWW